MSEREGDPRRAAVELEARRKKFDQAFGAVNQERARVLGRTDAEREDIAQYLQHEDTELILRYRDLVPEIISVFLMERWRNDRKSGRRFLAMEAHLLEIPNPIEAGFPDEDPIPDPNDTFSQAYGMKDSMAHSKSLAILRARASKSDPVQDMKGYFLAEVAVRLEEQFPSSLRPAVPRGLLSVLRRERALLTPGPDFLDELDKRIDAHEEARERDEIAVGVDPRLVSRRRDVREAAGERKSEEILALPDPEKTQLLAAIEEFGDPRVLIDRLFETKNGKLPV